MYNNLCKRLKKKKIVKVKFLKVFVELDFKSGGWVYVKLK